MTLCYYCMGKLPNLPWYHRDSHLGKSVKICDKALEHFYHRYEDGKINSEQYQIVLKVIKGIRADLKEA